MTTIDLQKALKTKHGAFTIEAAMNIEPGSFVSIFGPSGSGKTSILRMIAGLTSPDKGVITVNGETWFDSAKGINISVQKRNIGFVFQDYTVFPNMTVRENVAFACQDEHKDAFIDELLEMVDLKACAGQNSLTLSGGQKQRLALIRALARRPKLLLMDEPFASVDHQLKQRLHEEVGVLYRRFAITTIFVSHELADVFKLSQKVFVLKEGRFVKIGHPNEVFHDENSSGKFKFVGYVVKIDRDDVIYIVSVQIGNSIVKSVATREEVCDLKIGDKVVLASKAFNPLIFKMDNV